MPARATQGRTAGPNERNTSPNDVQEYRRLRLSQKLAYFSLMQLRIFVYLCRISLIFLLGNCKNSLESENKILLVNVTVATVDYFRPYIFQLLH